MSDEAVSQDSPVPVDEQEFSEKFPDIEASNGQDQAVTENTSNQPDPKQVIAQWQERRAAEIAEIDSRNAQQKMELQEEAVKHIDSFYDEYNRKKQQNIESVRSEAERFLTKKKEFFEQENTTWDRVLQLINEDDADKVGNRDRSRFKEILQKLSGNPNAPGA